MGQYTEKIAWLTGRKSDEDEPSAAERYGLPAAAAVLGAGGLATAAFGYGTPQSTIDQGQRFVQQQRQYSLTPDYQRLAQVDYPPLAHDTAKMRVMGIPAATLTKLIRMTPLVPSGQRVYHWDQPHYDVTLQGSLPASVQYASEQEPGELLSYLHSLGTKPPGRSISRFLDQYDNLPKHNQHAIDSIRKLIGDVGDVRKNPVAVSSPEAFAATYNQLLDQYGQANGLGPRAKWNEATQRAVLPKFDAFAKAKNPVFWREKQVRDVLTGIMAQQHADGYERLFNAVRKGRDFSLKAAPWLLGGAAGLSGLYLLRRWLINRKAKQDENKQDLRQ